LGRQHIPQNKILDDKKQEGSAENTAKTISGGNIFF
jgi:hypothetical protein